LSSGGFLVSSEGRIVITEQDIRDHEGLSTNVTFESDTKFYAKLFRMAKDEGKRSARLQGMSARAKAAALRIAAEADAQEQDDTSV
jgi:hypothetical protein